MASRSLAISLTGVLLFTPLLNASDAPALNESAQKAIKALLADRDPNRRAHAAQLLGTTEPTAAEIHQALARALSDPDDNVAMYAATSLGQIGSPAFAQLEALAATLRRDSEHVRYAAAWATRQIVDDLTQQNVAPPEDELEAQLNEIRDAEAAMRDAGAWRPAELLGEALSNLRTLAPPKETDADPASDTGADSVDEPDAAADKLLRQLRTGDSFARVQAAYELGGLGPEGVDAMVEALRIAHGNLEEGTEFDDYVAIWPTIRESLIQVGRPAVPQLAAALAEPSIAYIVQDILIALGPDAVTAAPRLIELLRDDQAALEVRCSAAAVLANLGADARNAVEPLTRIVCDEDEMDELRGSAARTLGALGEVARSAVPQIIPVMENSLDSDSVRDAVLESLGGIQAPKAEILSALLNRIENEQELDYIKATAVRSLASFGEDASSAAPTLVRLLDADDQYLRWAAIDALAGLESPPAEATEPLLRLVESEEADEEIQTAIGHILTAIGPDAINKLVERLSSPDDEVQMHVATIVARIGEPAGGAVEPLREMLRHDSTHQARRMAVIALGRLGPASESAVADLTALLASEDEGEELRAMAANALGELGAVAAASAGQVSRTMLDPESPCQVRAACALAVARISPEGTGQLLRALECEQPMVQIAAARALYEANLTKGRALPVLLSALNDDMVSYIVGETFRGLGDAAIQQLCETVRDKSLDINTRANAIHMLGKHYGLSRWEDEVARVLVDTLSERGLGDDAELALYGLGPCVIPHLMRELEQLDDAGDDATRRQHLQELIVRLCVPTGAGGEGGWSDDPTGFQEYDELSMYREMHRATIEPSRAPHVEEDAWPEETAVPEAEPIAELPFVEPTPLADAPAEPTPAADAGFETVKVFYGTNRKPERLTTLTASPSLSNLLPAAIAGLATMLFGLFSLAASRARLHSAIGACGLVVTVVLAYNATDATVLVEQTVEDDNITYTGQHSDLLHLGTCEVTIPDVHQRGELEEPSIFHLEMHEDPLKHVVLQKVEEYESNAFYDELRNDLATEENSILVFVHGYNVTFEDAARRTAQMAYDLEFQGAPMFYSWPSHGNWYRYREDETNVELAVTHMKKFLLDVVRESKADSIHLVAHSMGNRALTGALREIELEAKGQDALFNQVVLAAPDINAQVFKQTIAPAITREAKRVTLYASSNDLALAASRVFNAGGARAGDTSAGPVIFPGIETIDVSNVDTSLLGHSYYGSNETILDDLKLVLGKARSAEDRPRLAAVAREEGKYWVYGVSSVATRPESAASTTR